jgi:hypothetical protein
MPKFGVLSLLLFLAAAVLKVSTVVAVVEVQTLASTAALPGTVSESSGSRVPNASVTVTLRSPEQGIARAFQRF